MHTVNILSGSVRLLVLVQCEGGGLVARAGRAVRGGGLGGRLLYALGRDFGQFALGEVARLPSYGQKYLLFDASSLVH